MERRILILSASAFFAVLLAGAFFQPGMLGRGRAASDDPAGPATSLATGADDAAPLEDPALSVAYDYDSDEYDDDGHEDDHDDDDHDNDDHDDDDHDDEYEDDD